MKPIFIKLNDCENGQIIFVNIATIETLQRSEGEEEEWTNITFTDGALEIKETPEEIIELIKNA